MTTITRTDDYATIERVLSERAGLRPSFSSPSAGRFSATVYWPSGDVLRDKLCHGLAGSIAEAIDRMEAEIVKAEAAGKKLKTAAECKAAVIDLIREHEAAPASFRDAVDALPVE